MATESLIRANRANAAKSTSPVTPEGKRATSQNAPRRDLIASTVVYKAESIRRFNDLAADLTLQLQPRNSVEAGLVQTMTAARWRLLRMWGMQTAAFELEMARASKTTQASGAVLAAIAFRTLADTSRSLPLMHRFEIAYDRQYTRALALLLKLRRASDFAPPIDPFQPVAETRDDDSPDEPNQDEPNFDANPGNDPTCNECNEPVPDITPSETRFEVNPISPCPSPQGSDAPAPSKQPAVSAVRMTDTRHENGLGSAQGAAPRASDSAVPVDPLLQLATETRDDDSQGGPNQDEPNFDTNPGNDPTCNEQAPDITRKTPRFEMSPISPGPQPPRSDAAAPSTQPTILVFRMPDTRHESVLGRTSLAENAPPVGAASPLSGP